MGSIGQTITSSGWASFGQGQFIYALGNLSHASGYEAGASGVLGTARGNYASALGWGSTAWGNHVTASGDSAYALGLIASATTITTEPEVTGNQSMGIFMGDQDGGVDLSDANTLGLFGGRMVIDPNVPATNLSADTALEVDGTIKMAYGGEACDASREGAIDHFELALKNTTPHVLCDYAYRLAQAFSSFYGNCHILSEEDEVLRASRLALCALMHRQLVAVLGMLGITVPERM